MTEHPIAAQFGRASRVVHVERPRPGKETSLAWNVAVPMKDKIAQSNRPIEQLMPERQLVGEWPAHTRRKPLDEGFDWERHYVMMNQNHAKCPYWRAV